MAYIVSFLSVLFFWLRFNVTEDAMPQPICTNTLFYGDNLSVLREHIADVSVDLIYLDPPFNSSRNYNLIYKDAYGNAPEAQAHAFADSWTWNDVAERTYYDLTTLGPSHIGQLLSAMRQILTPCALLAYLVMMTARLIQLYRVLKPTGSLYLHCDPTASHYLKMVLDTIFGPERFLSEIIWKRTSAHSSAKRPGPVHDVILLYAKSDQYTWNQQFQPYDQAYIDTFFDHTDPDGRRWKRTDLTGAGTRNGETGRVWRGIDVTAKGRHWAVPPAELDRLDAEGKLHWPTKASGMPRLKQYADSMPGVPLQDIWDDIRPLHNLAAERLGYPTQKPLALLDRILLSSSNPGDVVLDPFCGCGTAIDAAERLKRQWIGIDITHLAIQVIQTRLKDTYPDLRYDVRGEPQDLASAQKLALDNRLEFQRWAAWLVRARSIEGAASENVKRGADRGIDGIIPFQDEIGGPVRRVIVQVKSGNLKPDDIRALLGVVEREQAAMGILITLKDPTKPMRVDAAAAGVYTSSRLNRVYARLQILTIADLLNGATVAMPMARRSKAAPRAAAGNQPPLDLLDAVM